MHGSEPWPAEFTRDDALILNSIAAKHGVVKLRARIDVLLQDTEPFVWKAASPELLKKRWPQLGAGKAPVKRTQLELDTATAMRAIGAKDGAA